LAVKIEREITEILVMERAGGLFRMNNALRASVHT
jgi:hypothetical protein